MRLWDLSPPIDARLAVWPGDTPPSREVLLDLARGDTVTLSTLRATVHLGSHADAPSHYGRDAPAIDSLPLELHWGPAQVLHVPAQRGTRLGPAGVIERVSEERVLLATGTYPDSTRFRDDFCSLSPELVHALGERGVRLVGVDTPSVDAFDSKDLPAHHACLARGVAILEGLVLAGVPEGRYELAAIPLRLVGFDGSPVRAVLRGPL